MAEQQLQESIFADTIALFTVNFAHLRYNKIWHVCESISGYFVVLEWNCLVSMFVLHCNANEKHLPRIGLYGACPENISLQRSSELEWIRLPLDACGQANSIWIRYLWAVNWIFQSGRKSCGFKNRKLKQRRLWATDVNRKSRPLLFDAYHTIFIQRVKLQILKWEFCNSLVGLENVLKART